MQVQAYVLSAKTNHKIIQYCKFNMQVLSAKTPIRLFNMAQFFLMANIICINIKNEKSIKEWQEKERGTKSTLYQNPTFSKVDIEKSKTDK
jgi:hypothetical protein